MDHRSQTSVFGSVLTDQELLVSTYDSQAVAGDAYAVNADLYLRTPADVAAGQYTSTLTLSLFE